MITGATGNLGSATAHAFAAQGARLALVDHQPHKVDALRALLPEKAVTQGFTADLTDAPSVNAMVEQVIQTFGSVDALTNIAGGFTMGPAIQDTGDRDWDFMMDLNARSVFHTTRAVLPHMVRRRSGRIVNVSARAALQGKGNMGPYCASKAAVITLTETLAAENRDTNINVNCILPGTIDTPQNREAMPNADHDAWVPPAALADVVLFLCSDAARCVSGAAIPVFGRS
ncbi:MAG: SDR family NAD(P)-dependent oxidoreductase [Pseudomonadota bacterium]